MPRDAAPWPDDGVEDNLGCFGWLRGVRDRAVCLELRKRSGDILAIPYSWAERFEFSPSDGVTIQMRGGVIRISGRHLNVERCPGIRLFEGITRHRVSWIQEAGSSPPQDNEQMTVVETIHW